jgi:prepilin signal peptidase PulO-like enzyme (type II secretory pathway)
LLAAVVHPGLVLAAVCLLAVCVIPLAFIDLAARRLPDVLTGPAYAVTALFLLLAAVAGGEAGDVSGELTALTEAGEPA